MYLEPWNKMEKWDREMRRWVDLPSFSSMSRFSKAIDSYRRFATMKEEKLIYKEASSMVWSKRWKILKYKKSIPVKKK